jgi:hypothetical protein
MFLTDESDLGSTESAASTSARGTHALQDHIHDIMKEVSASPE